MVYTRNKGIFIILSYLYTPTSDKKVQQNENVEFVDRLKNRHYNSATVILDMINKKFIKNRTENKSFLSIVEHVRKGYPKEFQSLLEITKLESEYKSEPEEIALEAEEVLKEIEEKKATKKKATKKKATKKKATKKKATKKKATKKAKV